MKIYMKRLSIVLLILFSVIACKEDTVTKPSAVLRLEYPEASYIREALDGCPYHFDVNTNATVIHKDNCWANIEYPGMKATVYLTYQRVNNNIDSLLRDAQKLTYDHSIKAQTIIEQMRVDEDNDVYGMFYAIDGEAATQSQFYVTDSVKHFVTGSLYFKAKPNYDSIYPAVVYLQEDIRHIMETIKWEN